MGTNFKKNRSDSYQVLFHESPYSPEVLAEFSDFQGYCGRIDNSSSEERHELKERLKAAFWRIVEQLTPRQRQVLRLYADGYTQMEIAKKLKVNQSSITKSINGNTDYSKNQRKVYGGARKRILRLSQKDPEMQEILKKISELDD